MGLKATIYFLLMQQRLKDVSWKDRDKTIKMHQVDPSRNTLDDLLQDITTIAGWQVCWCVCVC